jgi:hypothetical protein
LELLQSLNRISAISPESLPSKAVVLVVVVKAVIRNCTFELLKLERGEIEAREIDLEAMKHAAGVLSEALSALEERANALALTPRSIAANHADAWELRASALNRGGKAA